MTTKELIEKMNTDETLCKKLEICKTPEEAYAIAKESGLTDDLETFTAFMTTVNKQIKGELSDEEMEDITGGNSDGLAIAEAVVSGVVVIGGTASAAAAAA